MTREEFDKLKWREPIECPIFEGVISRYTESVKYNISKYENMIIGKDLRIKYRQTSYWIGHERVSLNELLKRI